MVSEDVQLEFANGYDTLELISESHIDQKFEHQTRFIANYPKSLVNPFSKKNLWASGI